jgi:hypothetical protein
MTDPVIDWQHDHRRNDHTITPPSLQLSATNLINVKVSVLLLCGLPGSGKSTLARTIVDHYRFSSTDATTGDAGTGGDDNGPSSDSFDKVVYIEYDEITNTILQEKKKINNESNIDVSLTDQEEEEELTLLVDCLEAWRQTRYEALRRFQNELELLLAKTCLSCRTQSINDTAYCNEQSSPLSFPMSYRILIVMDDNFHLRSMRRNVYKICQSILEQTNHDCQDNNDIQTLQENPLQIGFVTIHVNTPLEKCIDNNEQRIGTKRYVPPRIIQKMYHSMEPPNGEKVNFEKASMDTCALKVDPACPNGIFYQHLESLLKQYFVVASVVVDSNKKDLKAIEQDRLATFKSITHRIDLMLRSLVASVCRINKKYGKCANHARKIILTECKEGSSSLDTLLRPMNQDKNSYDDDDDEDITLTRNLQNWVRKRYKEVLLKDFVDMQDHEEIQATIQRALL